MAPRISPLCATFKRRKRPLGITHVIRYPRTCGQRMHARQTCLFALSTIRCCYAMILSSRRGMSFETTVLLSQKRITTIPFWKRYCRFQRDLRTGLLKLFKSILKTFRERYTQKFECISYTAKFNIRVLISWLCRHIFGKKILIFIDRGYGII